MNVHGAENCQYSLRSTRVSAKTPPTLPGRHRLIPQRQASQGDSGIETTCVGLEYAADY